MRPVRVVAGMCRVEHIALGCSAIQRGAFELLISSGIVGKRPHGFLQTAATKTILQSLNRTGFAGG
jgi:hypothetical protein